LTKVSFKNVPDEAELEWVLMDGRLTLSNSPKSPRAEGTDQAASHSGPILSEDELRERYKFWSKTASEVSLADIPALLSEYKRLVLVEVNLLKKGQISAVNSTTIPATSALVDHSTRETESKL